MAAVYLDGRLLDSRVQWLCINSELDVSMTLISLVDNPVSDAGNLPAAVKAHKNAQQVSSPTVVSQRLPAPIITLQSSHTSALLFPRRRIPQDPSERLGGTGRVINVPRATICVLPSSLKCNRGVV